MSERRRIVLSDEPEKQSPVIAASGLEEYFIEHVHSAVARWQVDGDSDETVDGRIDAALLGLAVNVSGYVLALVARRNGGHAYIATRAAALAQSITDRAVSGLNDDRLVRCETR